MFINNGAKEGVKLLGGRELGKAKPSPRLSPNSSFSTNLPLKNSSKSIFLAVATKKRPCFHKVVL